MRRPGPAPLLICALVLGPLCAALYLPALGGPGLLEPDEGRYAALGAAVADGDWLVPGLDGIPYLEKPPMHPWLAGVSVKLFGRGNAGPRLVSVAAGTATVLLVAWWTAVEVDLLAGLAAGVVLASSLGWVLLSRLTNLDGLLTFWTTLLTVAYLRSVDLDSRAWWWTAVLAGAGGFLTKGPEALVLPGLTVAIAGWWGGDPRLLSPRRWVPLVLLTLAAVLPWHVAAERACPGFLRVFYWEHHVQRFFTPRFHRHMDDIPLVAVWAVVLLPWAPLMAWCPPWSPRCGPRRWRTVVWTAALAPLVLFSLSSSHLPTYIVPGLPFMACAAGVALAAACGSRRAGPWWALGGTAMALGLGVGLAWAAHRADPRWQAAGAAVVLLASVAFLGSLAIRTGRAGHTRAALASAGAVAILLTVATWIAVGVLAPHKSVAGLVAPLAGQEGGLATIGQYRGAAYYLGRPVWIAGRAGEVAGWVDLAPSEAAARVNLAPERLAELIASGRVRWVLADEKDLDKPVWKPITDTLRVVARQDRYVLLER